MLENLISSFISFFTVIDPIGTIPVFIAVTAGHSETRKKIMARRAALTAGGVLLFFIVVGEILLNLIDIPLSTFQVAGGIVLFLFSITMIFGESKPESEINRLDEDYQDKAIFPLAMPSLASPGAMLAAVLLTENGRYNFWEQVMITLTMILTVFIAWICMRLSTVLFRYIGNGGAAIISRVMGLIIASVAVSNVLNGLTVYFSE